MATGMNREYLFEFHLFLFLLRVPDKGDLFGGHDGSSLDVTGLKRFKSSKIIEKNSSFILNLPFPPLVSSHTKVLYTNRKHL